MTLAERIERTPLAWPMALLMAGAVTFLIFAMPPAIVARLLDGTGAGGLASLGADGIGGRAVLAALFAGAAGGAVWLLFHMLDGPHLAFADLNDAEAEDIDLFAPVTPAVDTSAPQLRRADAHPDAPPRRPIFAASDLGAPLHPVPVPAPAPLPVMAEPTQPEAPATIHRAPIFRDPAPRDAPVVAALPEPAVAEECEPEPVRPNGGTTGADVLMLDPFLLPAHDASPDVRETPALAPVTADVAAPVALDRRSGEETVAELMARLERGLSARSGAAVPPPGSGGDLRRALDDLRRIARS